MKKLLIFSLVLALSCNNRTIEIPDNESYSHKIIVPKHEFGSDNFVKVAKYVFLDQSYLIGKIGRLLFYNERIYIHDEMVNRIAVFSDTGKYLFRIDNKGRGAMEYLELTDFTIDKKNNDLLIFDEMTHKVITFSLSKNKFIKEKKIDFYPTAFAWETDYLYFYNPFTFNYPRREKYHYSIIQTNLKLKEEERYFEVEENTGNFMSNPNKKGFSYGNNLYFRNRFENLIYKLDNGNIDVHCEIVFEDNSDFKYALEDAIEKGTRDTELYHKCAKDIQDYCESNNFITFRYGKEKRLFSVIYSKRDDKVIYHKSKFKYFSEELIKNGIPIIRFPSNLKENYFVSQIPFSLIEYLEKEKGFMQLFEENVKDSILIQKFKIFDANSNPCLAFYEID